MTATETPIDTPEPEATAVVPEPSVALVPTGSGSVINYLPGVGEWQVISQIANELAQSELVPKEYYRKPYNVVLAILAGRPFGWEPTMSMRSFHIIEGKPSMKPEIMLALVRAAGHSVSGEKSGSGVNSSATIKGRRRDTGDTASVTWTVEDAVAADLCEIKDGKIRARSDRGKIKPWEAYPKAMLWARCVSELCRMLFSDVVLGAGYTPEELGAWVDEDGEPVQLAEIVPTAQAPSQRAQQAPASKLPPPPDGMMHAPVAKNEILEALGGRGDTEKAIAKDVWHAKYGDTNPPLIPEGDMVDLVTAALAKSADDATIVDAEIVEPDRTDTGKRGELMRRVVKLSPDDHEALCAALINLGHDIRNPVASWSDECVEDAFGWLEIN